MIGKCNTGGENLTTQLDNQDAIITEIEAKVQSVSSIDMVGPVNAQTLTIEQIQESLTGKALGANATADKILQGYSAYVGQELINGTFKPSGMYIWSKYELQKTHTITQGSTLTSNLDGLSGPWTFYDELIIDDENKTVTLGGTTTSVTSYSSSLVGKYKYVSDGIMQFTSYDSPSLGYLTYVIVDFITAKNFLDYVVSDDFNAYPDGGEQGGYWYERYNFSSLFLGCTKHALDNFTFTEITDIGSETLSHSLGVAPKVALLVPNSVPSIDRSGNLVLWSGVCLDTSGRRGYTYIKTYPESDSAPLTASGIASSIYTWNETQIRPYGASDVLAGIKYTLITMA